MGFFTKISQHMELMARMFGKTGIAGADSDVVYLENDIRQAMSRCASCQDVGGCMLWLDDAEDGSAPPDFCMNATYIKQLQKTA